jgi:thiol-disulfide isomerase/thioredoxin
MMSMTSDQSRSTWIYNAALLLVAAGAIYVVFSLARENRELKAQLRAQQASPLDLSVAADESIPDVAMLSLTGQRARLPQIVAGGGVIAFLTTTCPYCRETLPTWVELASAYEAVGVPFVGVSLHDAALTAAYVNEHDIEFPMWVAENPLAAGDLRVASVPFTVLVKDGAIVEEVWLGPLGPAAVDRVMAALGSPSFAAAEVSRLPGIDPATDCCSATGLGAGPTR